MKHHQVIIIGGGPAGAACAWRLIHSGVDCLILDKQLFPRTKTCAGWITPQVFQYLNCDPHDYPYSLSSFPALRVTIYGIPLIRPGKQYAIRRIEFDHWLLERSGAPIVHHDVKHITSLDDGYSIDGEYSAEFLIGAGGTHCPVYHTYFNQNYPRKGEKLVALETEFPEDWQDGRCQLWFFEKGLPGYSWYVPKAGGYINIGVGGNASVLKQLGSNIHDHWDLFCNKLHDLHLVSKREFEPDGYVYYMRGAGGVVQQNKALIIGDSAGLATLDMGEGIGPAIKSGLLAADAILNGDLSYSIDQIKKISLLPWFFRWFVT
jgi:flavin-dependent dehydrogenase